MTELESARISHEPATLSLNELRPIAVKIPDLPEYEQVKLEELKRLYIDSSLIADQKPRAATLHHTLNRVKNVLKGAKSLDVISNAEVLSAEILCSLLDAAVRGNQDPHLVHSLRLDSLEQIEKAFEHRLDDRTNRNLLGKYVAIAGYASTYLYKVKSESAINKAVEISQKAVCSSEELLSYQLVTGSAQDVLVALKNAAFSCRSLSILRHHQGKNFERIKPALRSVELFNQILDIQDTSHVRFNCGVQLGGLSCSYRNLSSSYGLKHSIKKSLLTQALNFSYDAISFFDGLVRSSSDSSQVLQYQSSLRIQIRNSLRMFKDLNRL